MYQVNERREFLMPAGNETPRAYRRRARSSYRPSYIEHSTTNRDAVRMFLIFCAGVLCFGICNFIADVLLR